jgi:hypothetical protein
MVGPDVQRLAVAVLLMAATTAAAVHGGPGGLRFAGDVPGDVRSLAAATWARFEAAFPGHPECLRPMALLTRWSFPDRGEYEPRTHRVVLRIPGTTPNLSATLVHEFAHHLEFTCAAQRELRPAFLAAQGFAPGTAWFGGPSWARTPSEQFAEAAVLFVLGERAAHSPVVVTDGALAAIRAWAAADASGLAALTHGP